MEYVVYSRGVLRVEGPVTNNCDYVMNNGRPSFHGSVAENDIVSIFVYDGGCLVERRDYHCAHTAGGQSLKAKRKVVTYF